MNWAESGGCKLVSKQSTGCSTNNGTIRDDSRTDAAAGVVSDKEIISERMSLIRNKIIVLSGKGGVGKSTIAANLAIALCSSGKRVGILDIDLHGPSVPLLLDMGDTELTVKEGNIYPAMLGELKVISVGFLLNNKDDAVIWRGPLKMSVIKQFVKDVAWGELDYLIVDCPPGTGDEPLSIVQLLTDHGNCRENSTRAVVVTTPQELSLADVRKSLTFCEKLGLSVIGIIENMSGFVCPKCGEISEIYGSGGGQRTAQEMKVPFLGRIPLDPAVVSASDAGKAFISSDCETATSNSFDAAIERIVGSSTELPTPNRNTESRGKENDRMRVAIPLAEKLLSMHFGHCQEFVLIDVDVEKKEIIGSKVLPSPEHQPGLLPKWLQEQGANLIIAGGMGMRAQNLFAEAGIDVLVGAPSDDPVAVVNSYLNGTLETGSNVCDH